MAPARHLGVDHDLGCAVRMITCMTAMGEAAGNIAVWAQQNNLLPHEIPYEEVQKFLPPNPVAVLCASARILPVRFQICPV